MLWETKIGSKSGKKASICAQLSPSWASIWASSWALSWILSCTPSLASILNFGFVFLVKAVQKVCNFLTQPIFIKWVFVAPAIEMGNLKHCRRDDDSQYVLCTTKISYLCHHKNSKHIDMISFMSLMSQHLLQILTEKR